MQVTNSREVFKNSTGRLIDNRVQGELSLVTNSANTIMYIFNKANNFCMSAHIVNLKAVPNHLMINYFNGGCQVGHSTR